LSHTSSLANSVVENIAEDARRDRFFRILACPAGELEAVGIRIFFGIQHIGTFATETECNLLHVLLGSITRIGGCWGRHVAVSLIDFEWRRRFCDGFSNSRNSQSLRNLGILDIDPDRIW